jgi:hypothetical protein
MLLIAKIEIYTAVQIHAVVFWVMALRIDMVV